MKSIVYLDERLPSARTSSGDNRALSILDALSGVAPTYAADCQGPDVVLWGTDSQRVCALGELSRFADLEQAVVWVARPSAWRLSRWLRGQSSTLRFVYDTVDVHLRRATTALSFDDPLSQATAAGLLWERDAVRRADLSVAVSAADASRLAGAKIVSIVRNPFFLHDTPLRAADPGAIGFVANFGHQPNRDGYSWFVEEVLPLVRQSLPEATFNVVGVGADQLPVLAEGVRLEGRVSDLKRTYDQSAVFVAPLRYGAGLKGKVAEAYEWGRPLVGTLEAYEGYPGGDWRREASDAETFARHVVELLADHERRQAVVDAGRRTLETFFVPGIAEEVLAAIKLATGGTSSRA